MTVALVTGSGGLIGSECARLLCSEGWEVIGIDNDLRADFFGHAASTRAETERLKASLARFQHYELDIRNREGVRELFDRTRPALIIHAAAQPSHDRSAAIPYDDFDVNAVGTLNLLVSARDYCRESPFCFVSSNKVYGDRPNDIPLIELDTRYEYQDGRPGIDESMSIDQCLHSPFGASKVAADVLCQEFARYFGMPVGIFRAGCLTGPQHAAVELHGYLAFIIQCALTRKPYTVHGHKGKQVRDQLHSRDLARLFLAFSHRPTAGEVYNVGGGRQNNISILETIELLAFFGHRLNYQISEVPRKGDHICYITDLARVERHYPEWQQEYTMQRIISEIIEEKSRYSTVHA